MARPTDTMCAGFRIREIQRCKDLDLPTEEGLFSGNAGGFLGVGMGVGVEKVQGALGWLVMPGHLGSGLLHHSSLYCTHSEQGEVS